MEISIGQIIKKVATEQGFSQQQLGDKINKTKQGVASIYRRSTIDIELLKEIALVLNHDFLAYYYNEGPFKVFRDLEISNWEQKINELKEQLNLKDSLLDKNEEILLLQRKYIVELEERLRQK
ncbi:MULTISPECIES: helix-turn-helix domain-containing protein [Sphingobacterium]|uniref:helix-turn-helix domain-containing protein n=1 Tax=Sphingobacterium TaxID=28453 RepID=UPI0013E4F605|nr:helix-turn-helix domain-containing protein [Sphingobacterium sp. DR205]QIH31495.1 helix-turn-helix domain-containing protein [Sphingobacterium sp. DR205]